MLTVCHLEACPLLLERHFTWLEYQGHGFLDESRLCEWQSHCSQHTKGSYWMHLESLHWNNNGCEWVISLKSETATSVWWQFFGNSCFCVNHSNMIIDDLTSFLHTPTHHTPHLSSLPWGLALFHIWSDKTWCMNTLLFHRQNTASDNCFNRPKSR